MVSRKGYVPPLHWYPGTFVRGLSDAAIQALSVPGALVLDPFGGIGTTACSAILNSRRAHSIDIHPVASLASYVSTGLLVGMAGAPEAIALSFNALDAIVQPEANSAQTQLPYRHPDISQVDERLAPLLFPAAGDFLAGLNVRGPNWPALANWVAPSTLKNIGSIRSRIDELPSHFVRAMGLCMLSAIARTASSQHASWGHIADNVFPKTFEDRDIGPPALRWLQNARRFSSLAARLARGGATPSATVTLGDAGRTAAQEPVDLLLTSPPYAGAIDYVLSQKLSLYFLGYSEREVTGLVGKELGARRKRFGASSRTDWSEGLVDVLDFHQAGVKPDGVICLILPHKDSGRSVGEDSLRLRLAERDWHLVFSADRSIHQSHTRQSWTSIKKETILCFMRGAS